MSKFKEYSALDLSAVNKSILDFWRQESVFEKSLGEKNKSYNFYEGPPSANGMPGIHHVIARTIKDLFADIKHYKDFTSEEKPGGTHMVYL